VAGFSILDGLKRKILEQNITGSDNRWLTAGHTKRLGKELIHQEFIKLW
jgi:hypothetical protein